MGRHELGAQPQDCHALFAFGVRLARCRSVATSRHRRHHSFTSCRIPLRFRRLCFHHSFNSARISPRKSLYPHTTNPPPWDTSLERYRSSATCARASNTHRSRYTLLKLHTLAIYTLAPYITQTPEFVTHSARKSQSTALAIYGARRNICSRLRQV